VVPIYVLYCHYAKIIKKLERNVFTSFFLSHFMDDRNVTVAILAATEAGGMGPDYFENKTRHLLPIAGKPFIKYIIEVLDENDQIGKKYIIIQEKLLPSFEAIKPCEETYNAISGNRINNDIFIAGQNIMTSLGTFEAIREFISKIGYNVFPLLIILGDTSISKDFLYNLLKVYFEKDNKSKIVWGLTNDNEGIGTVLTKRIERANHFFNMKSSDIIDVFECKKQSSQTYDIFHDTGAMLISKTAWDNISLFINKFHRPSSFGFFSFSSVLKQILAFSNINIFNDEALNISISFVVAEKGNFYEANYPWEVLDFNLIKLDHLGSENVRGASELSKIPVRV
jgi:hypothetical protein